MGSSLLLWQLFPMADLLVFRPLLGGLDWRGIFARFCFASASGYNYWAWFCFRHWMALERTDLVFFQDRVNDDLLLFEKETQLQ